MARALPLAVALLAALPLFGAGEALPGLPAEAEDGVQQAIAAACDERTKQCLAASPFTPLDPQTGSATRDYWTHMLEPYLPREQRLLLESLWPAGGVPPPLPLPPRPREAGANETLGHTFGERILGIQLNVTFGAQVNASVGLVGSGGPDEPGQVPCSDPRGCPDLLVDGSRLLEGVLLPQTFAATDCNVQEGSAQAGARWLLRFTTTMPNLGDGDLIIGDPADHPEWFEWGACHRHWHFRTYAEYRLWRPGAYLEWLELRRAHPESKPSELLDAHPELRDGFVAGHKQGFCSIDVLPYLLVEPPKYWNCYDAQGVSRGWADEYHLLLDGQFIDVTGLPPGPYVLDVEANPERFYREIDYANNSGAALVALPPTP